MKGIKILDPRICFAKAFGTGNDKILYVVAAVEGMLLIVEVIYVCYVSV